MMNHEIEVCPECGESYLTGGPFIFKIKDKENLYVLPQWCLKCNCEWSFELEPLTDLPCETGCPNCVEDDGPLFPQGMRSVPAQGGWLLKRAGVCLRCEGEFTETYRPTFKAG